MIDTRPLYHIITSAIFAGLVVAPYHLYILLETGNLIPSSVSARSWCYSYRLAILPFPDNVIAILQSLFLKPKNLLQNISIFMLLLLSSIKVRNANKSIYNIILASSFVFVLIYLIRFPWHQFDRYTFILVPGLSIIAGDLVYAKYDILLEKMEESDSDLGIYVVTIGLILIIIGGGFSFQIAMNEFELGSGSETIGNKETAEFINSHSEPHDVILLREIQFQYQLKRQAISGDGIVGGEILPYLRNEDRTIYQFVKKYNITIIWGASVYNEFPEYRDTALYSVAQKSDEDRQKFIVNNITFINMGKSGVYCLEYDEHSCGHHTNINTINNTQISASITTK